MSKRKLDKAGGNLDAAFREVKNAHSWLLAQEDCRMTLQAQRGHLTTCLRGGQVSIPGAMLREAQVSHGKYYVKGYENYRLAADVLAQSIPKNTDLMDVLSGNGIVPITLLHAGHLKSLTMVDAAPPSMEEFYPTTGVAWDIVKKLRLKRAGFVGKHISGDGSLPAIRDVTIGFTGLPLPMEARQPNTSLDDEMELLEPLEDIEREPFGAPHILESDLTLAHVLSELSQADASNSG